MARWLYFGGGQLIAGLLVYCPQNISIFRQTPVTQVSGSVVYCPQNISLFRTTPAISTSLSLVYCPQDINQFDRP